jgi:hypothetical protein
MCATETVVCRLVSLTVAQSGRLASIATVNQDLKVLGYDRHHCGSHHSQCLQLDLFGVLSAPLSGGQGKDAVVASVHTHSDFDRE